LVRKYERRGLLQRPKHVCKYNIKMDIQEVGHESMDCIQLP
jgi:hypothetical protein